MWCDLRSCVATVATIEDIEAAAHRICHEGDPRPNVFVSHAVNDCPPTAGKAVRVAASVPPRIVMLRSRRLRGSSADINLLDLQALLSNSAQKIFVRFGGLHASQFNHKRRAEAKPDARGAANSQRRCKISSAVAKDVGVSTKFSMTLQSSQRRCKRCRTPGD